MGFVPIEKLTNVVKNKYEAVLVAARDARILNSIAGLQDLDPNEPQAKVTTESLERLIRGDVKYFYPGEEGADVDEAASQEAPELLDVEESE